MTASPKSSVRTVRNDLVPNFIKQLDRYTPDLERNYRAEHPDLARELVQEGIRNRASDIHLEPQHSGTRIRFRIDGVVFDVAHAERWQSKWLVNQLKAMADLDPVVRFLPTDAHATFHWENYSVDLRLALAPSKSGEIVSVRLLDVTRLERSLDDLGLTQHNLELLESWLEGMNGMFLAAGPTGCGKTTTVYALLHELKFADRTIISLEDPVEYQIDGINQIQVDTLHHLNFGEGVKAMLRLDPDYLMLGEIRDAASAYSAVNAAITGRVLLSTIHARDAVGSVTALRNWGLTDAEIGEALAVVVAQRLVRKICPQCRRQVALTRSDRQWLQYHGLAVPKRSWHAIGCEACQFLGYYGRTGVFDLWRVEESDYTQILTHVDEHALRQHLKQRGHLSFLHDGIEKVAQGITSITELRRVMGGALPVNQTSVGTVRTGKKKMAVAPSGNRKKKLGVHAATGKKKRGRA